MTQSKPTHANQFFTQKEKYFTLLKFSLPFVLWAILMRDLVFGRALIVADTFTFYAQVKFYFTNLMHGVYPLWSPYVVFGMPAGIEMSCIGVFNPFLYLILALNLLGISFYQSFLVYLVGYFFVGLLGFYLLAKSILRDSLVAYVSYLMLMFSSLGMTMFSQINMLSLFVPAVWCAYFAIEWVRGWDTKNFAGLVFTIMIILTTYLPFYIFTVFLVTGIFWAVICFKEIKMCVAGAWQFCHRHLALKLFCLLALLISLISPVMSYRAATSQDMVLPTRHFSQETVNKGGLAMRYEDMIPGGITTKMAVEDLFSNHDRVGHDNDGFVFVPLFMFLLLGATAFNKITKQSLILFASGFFLFLTALGNAGGLHRFLFDHVNYFQLLRNLYYFLPFILGLLVLFAGEQLRVFLSTQLDSKKSRLLFVALNVVVHAGFLAYLSRGENVILSSYLTVAASFCCFTLYGLGWFEQRKNLWAGVLVFLTLLQPAQVLYFYNKNSALYKSDFISRGVAFSNHDINFYYSRPDYTPSRDVQGDVESYNYYRLTLTDSPGFVTYHYGYPTRNIYPLLSLGTDSEIQAYAKNKFVVYDNTPAQAGMPQTPAALKESLSRNKNTSFVVGANSDSLKVTDFNVNRLKLATNFNKGQFLVYNDSFHSKWKAFINGTEAPLIRANMAFKGVVLPAGKNIVEFCYAPFGGQGIYFFILAFFFSFFGYMVYLFTSKR